MAQRINPIGNEWNPPVKAGFGPVPPPADPVLTIVKSQDADEVELYAAHTYTVVVTNTGTVSAALSLIYDFPPGQFVFGSCDVAYAGGAAGPSSATEAELLAGLSVTPWPVGGAATLTIIGSFDAAGSFENTARAVPPAGSTVEDSVITAVVGSDACTCNVAEATVTEQGAALATSTYALRSARISGNGLALVKPAKASAVAGQGSAITYDRTAGEWVQNTSIIGIGANDGPDDIIATLSGDGQRMIVINQDGAWPAGSSNVYGFWFDAPGGTFDASNDGFTVYGSVTPTGLPDPGARQYAAAVLDSTGDNLYLIGIDGATDAWVIDRYVWVESGAPVNEGWLYADTSTPWGSEDSTPFAFNSVISGDDSHLAVRRGVGISVLTDETGVGWVESYTYTGITDGGYTVPLSLGPDGTCMLVAEAPTAAGPFQIWLTQRGETEYIRTAQLGAAFDDVPLQASDLYDMILFGDLVTPDVETFITNIVCSNEPPAITLTAPAPPEGFVDDESGNFTVTAARITAAVIVTPADNLAGTLAPATVTVQPGDLTKTFTLTPSVVGTHSVSITNDGGVTNPAPVNYEASTEPPPSNFVLDTFTGTAGTDLDTHVGELGAVWTDLFGNNGGSLYLLDGLGNLQGITIDSRYMACSGLPSGYPYDLGATLKFSSPSDVQDNQWFILFAYDSNDGNGFGIQVSLEFRDRGAGKTINANMYAAVSGGGSTSIARVDNIAPVDTDFTIRFEAENDQLTVNLLVNGIQIASLTRPSVVIPLTAFCGFRLLQTSDNVALMSEFSGNE